MDKQDSLCCTVEAYIHFISLIYKTKPFTLRYCWCCNSTRSFTMAIWERVQEMKSFWLKKKQKNMKHESILFLHLFFCFKINIWFLDEFLLDIFFNWIAGLLTVMWTLEHGDTFRGSSFFPFLVANLRTPLPTFWRVCNHNHGWIACRIEHCKAQQWGMKLYNIVFRLNNLQPQNLFFFNLQDNSLYKITVNK